MKMLSKRKNLVSSLIKIGKETIQGFIDDNVTRLSASLAYATLFSIIPFLSLLITFGVYLEFDLANQFYAQLDPIVGAKVIEALQSITENAEKTNISSFAAVVSLGVSIFGATTVFAEIQSALNTIWGIKAIPKRSWLKYIKNRLLSFSIILVFAFILLITSLSSSSEQTIDALKNPFPLSPKASPGTAITPDLYISSSVNSTDDLYLGGIGSHR